MSVHRAQEISLRLDRPDSSRLIQALVLSVALHLTVWGTYEAGKKYHLWEKIHLPPWIQALMQAVAKVAKKEPPPADHEAPLVFIDVSPEQATAEPPKDAKYYSSKNSQAANTEASKETDAPKIDGTQTQVPKTEEVPRNKFEKLQPAPPAPENQIEQRASSKPKAPPGDLAMAKPELIPRVDTGNAEQPRPRTIKEMLAKKQLDRVPGQRMKQDGGVTRRANMAMVDTKQTSFGAYDAAFIEAVRQRWYDLLDERRYSGERQGRVVLQFNLKYDGDITDMKVLEDGVGVTLSVLAQKAILDPRPFEKWPREMRLEIGSDTRTVKFAFFYN